MKKPPVTIFRLPTALMIAILAVGSVIAGPSTAPPEEINRIREMISKGDCEQVLTSTATALEQFPEDPDLLVLEGNCMLAQATITQERYNGIRYEQLRLGLGINQLPRSVNSQIYRSEKSYDGSKLRAALRSFKQARRFAPERSDIFVGSVAALVEAGKLDDALALLDGELPPLAKPEITDLARISQDMVKTGRPNQAAALADKLVQRFPGSVPAHTAAGAVALTRLRARPAIEHFAKAFELGAMDPAAGLRLSRLALLARDYPHAIKVLPTLASGDVTALAWLAMARSQLVPAASIPLWEQLDTRLGEIETPPKNLKKLLAHYLRILGSEQPLTSKMRFRAADVFIKDGLDLAAFTEVDAALRLDGNNVTAWLFPARRYRAMGLLDLALEALDGAAAATDSPSALLVQRVEVLIGLQEFESAQTAADAAEKQGADATYLRGIAALGAGRNKTAARFFRRAATPGNPDQARAEARLKELGL